MKTGSPLLDSPDNVHEAIRAANLTFAPADNHSIPFDSPHVQQPFVWGAPPVDDGDVSYYNTQNNFSPVATVTMSVKKLGPSITLGIFPMAQRVASTLFTSNSGLLSVDLVAAINNLSADGEVGVFVAKDTGPVIGVANSSDVYDGILAPLGQFCKRSGASFSLDICPQIKQGTRVGLYVVCYGANQATSSIAISCILRYASLDG